MKFPYHLVQDKRSNGWTSFALAMMAAASVGGIVWGIFTTPAETKIVKVEPQPEVSYPVMQSPTAGNTEPVVTKRRLTRCLACGMG